MKTCPGCGCRLMRRYSGDAYQFTCGSVLRAEKLNTTGWCREIQYRQILADVLPLARATSCVHMTDAAGHAEACCEWARIVERIEAAGVDDRDYRNCGLAGRERGAS